jgi:integrase
MAKRTQKPPRAENWLRQQTIDASLRPAALPAKKPVKLTDGGGLHLQINPNGSAWWRFRYRFHGIEKMLGLGVYPAVSLNAARARRDAERKILRGGKDPSPVRQSAKRAHGDTFKALAVDYYDGDARRTKLSATTRTRDERILEHLYDRLGAQPVASIETPELSAAVRAITKKSGHETAHRALGLAGRVFGFALECGKVMRDPSAGITLAPAKSTGRAAITQPAELGKLLVAMDKYDGEFVTRAGLQLLALLFTRPSELRLARWSELDVDGAQWLIPADRMKMRKEHIVPLPAQALVILEQLRPLTGRQPFVFLSGKRNLRGNAAAPMSEAAFGIALAKLGYKGRQHPHGFRVTASTLLHELGHTSELIETQLAHSRPGVWGVYNKSHLLPQRKALMAAWADYLDTLREAAKPK